LPEISAQAPVNNHGLEPRGRGAAFYRKAQAAYQFNADEAELLLEAARQLDMVERLHAIVSADGPMLGERLHPAVTELRQARDLLRKLLGQLAMPDEDADAGKSTSARSHKARHAAEVRWSLHGRHSDAR
jgi:hypothetical protein